MQHHIVWGKVETDDSYGASSEAAQLSRGRARGQGKGYLEGVVFNNESSGSASWSHTSSRPASRTSSRSSQAGPPPSSAVRAALVTLSKSGTEPRARARDTVARPPQDADSDACDEEGAQGVAAAMVQLEEGAQRRLVVELLAGPEIPGLGDFWSVGTAAHGTSACRPCHYVHTTSGCLNGATCEFCHLPHAKKTRPRPCKSRRVQTRRFGTVLEEVYAQQPQRFLLAMRAVALESAQAQALLESGALVEAPQARPGPWPGSAQKHILSL